MMRFEKLDMIGPARSADGQLLKQLNESSTIRVLGGNVVP
jgi:hypothetical protein